MGAALVWLGVPDGVFGRVLAAEEAGARWDAAPTALAGAGPGAEQLHLWRADWRTAGLLPVLSTFTAGVRKPLPLLGRSGCLGWRDVGPWGHCLHHPDARLVRVEI